MFFLNLKKT